MMMTQSYYGGDYDSIGRSNYRAPIGVGHYGRSSIAYDHAYYDERMPPHHELRSEYPGRPGARTLIHEHSPENGHGGNSRRRIQVACSRCRRRKIKCTGDPGDGSGCSACRSAQADKSSCTFIRVGSREMTLPGLDVVPTTSTSTSSSTPIAVPYAPEAASNSYSSSGMHQTSHSRPSLPMLHTRVPYPEYDSYNTSPVDDYTYASNTLPQHDSLSSNYSAEGFRPYTTASMAAPSVNASMYYEPSAAYSFGSLHAAPSYQPNTTMNRLPSVTGDSFSPLNMSSLHSSLPTQTVRERRLPVPYAPQQESYGSTQVPQIRPLTSFTEPQHRPHTGGIYSRNSMSWSMASPAPSRNASVNNSHGLPSMSSVDSDSLQNAAPILGYHFSSSGSPEETSPIAGSALSESFSSASSSSTVGASTLPPPSVRYATALPALRPSSAQEGSASLYSFSSGRDTSNVNQAVGDDLSSASRQQQAYNQVRHPQPQHAASVDELRRRSSCDQQQQQCAATAHRMSVSNLNARY